MKLATIAHILPRVLFCKGAVNNSRLCDLPISTSLLKCVFFIYQSSVPNLTGVCEGPAGGIENHHFSPAHRHPQMTWNTQNICTLFLNTLSHTHTWPARVYASAWGDINTTAQTVLHYNRLLSPSDTSETADNIVDLHFRLCTVVTAGEVSLEKTHLLSG